MPTVIYVQPDGTRITRSGSEGTSVMRVAVDGLVPGIVAECGGEMSCATCHVFVDELWSSQLPAKSTDEIDMLAATSEEPTEHSRLSCQIRLDASLEGLVVHIPNSQL